MLQLDEPEAAIMPLLRTPRTPLLPATFLQGDMPFELSRSILVHIAQGTVASRAQAARKMGLDWRTVKDWASPEYLLRHPELFREWLPSWQPIDTLPDALAPGAMLVLTGPGGNLAVNFEDWTLADKTQLSDFTHWMVL